MKPSRAMIPGEILCSLLGCVLAYFGGFHDGWLHSTLDAKNEAALWLMLLGGPAIISFIACVREWFDWPVWNLLQREASVHWRARAILIQGLCWLYAVYVSFGHEALLLGWISLICFAFCTWAYHENRRTSREIRYSKTVTG